MFAIGEASEVQGRILVGTKNKNLRQPSTGDVPRLAARSRAGWIIDRSEGESAIAADPCNITINKTMSW